MGRSLPDAALTAHHKRFEKADVADLKNLESWRRQVGQAIDYAISLSNRTQKEVWVALGHNDGAQLNRWIAATENAQLGPLFAIDWLRQPLVIALAGLANAELTTQITFRRTA